jgi:hypothetical protein
MVVGIGHSLITSLRFGPPVPCRFSRFVFPPPLVEVGVGHSLLAIVVKLGVPALGRVLFTPFCEEPY